MQIKIKKSALKQLEKLPRNIQILFSEFLKDLHREGMKIEGWSLKKLTGVSNTYRAKLSQRYRVIIEFKKPDLIIIKVASREGVYK